MEEKEISFYFWINEQKNSEFIISNRLKSNTVLLCRCLRFSFDIEKERIVKNAFSH